MNFLLDTNVISEATKPRPNQGIADWQARQNPASLYVSVATWAELRHGIVRLGDSDRASRLRSWLEQDLARLFVGRILAVDLRVADAWGALKAQRDAAGRPMAAMDALIAATAEVHHLTLVTRDVRDFEGTVTRLLNPWS